MLASLAGSVVRAPALFPAPAPSRSTTDHSRAAKIPSALFEFANQIESRDIPMAHDGLPLWNIDIFSAAPSQSSDPAADDIEARQRARRASLRPTYELLSGRTPVGNTNVGDALRDYGRILWNIKQQTAPRQGRARQLRERCVAGLGGPASKRGQEFIRRCKITSRFVIHLAALQNITLARYSSSYAHVVREEVEKLRIEASYFLSNGQTFPSATPARLTRAVECRIQRSESNWLTFPIFWIWSQMRC